MKPLRIGLFTDTFLPDHNGIVTSVLLLSDELQALGHEVEIVAPRFPNQGKDQRADVRRVRSLRYPFLPTYRLAWPTQRSFEQRYDLIHTHTPLTLGLAGARLARKWNVPHVATYHTHLESYTHYVPGMTALQRHTGVVTRVMGLFYRRADAVIAPTVGMMDVLRQMKVRRSVVIPTAIAPQVLYSAPALESPWLPGYRRVLTVGRLAREKRFDLVLEAVAMMPDTFLVIVGEGPERQHLQAQAHSLGIAERVKFLGVVPWTQIGSYYRLAELFLFASDTETQGLVLQEAQLMGVPVVAVGARGTLSGVAQGQSGYLVTPGNVSGLVQHSRRILDNPQLWQQLSVGAQQFGASWSPSGVAQRVVDVYTDVLGLPRTAWPQPITDGSSHAYDQ